MPAERAGRDGPRGLRRGPGHGRAATSPTRSTRPRRWPRRARRSATALGSGAVLVTGSVVTVGEARAHAAGPVVSEPRGALAAPRHVRRGPLPRGDRPRADHAGDGRRSPTSPTGTALVDRARARRRLPAARRACSAASGPTRWAGWSRSPRSGSGFVVPIDVRPRLDLRAAVGRRRTSSGARSSASGPRRTPPTRRAGLTRRTGVDRVRAMTQRTLVLLKPDAVRRGLVGEILSRFEAKGLTIVAMEHRTIDGELADRHYAEHVERDFYPPLRAFVTSGPMVVAGARGRRGGRGGARAERRHRRPQGRARHDPRRPVALEPREPRARLRLARVRRARDRRSGSPASDEPPSREGRAAGYVGRAFEASHGRQWFRIFWVTWLLAAVVVALLPPALRLTVCSGRPPWSLFKEFPKEVVPHPCRTRGFRTSSVGGRCLGSSYGADATKFDTARRGSRSRASNGSRRPGRRTCCRPRWAGRRCTRRTRSTRREMLVGYGDQGMPLAGEGAPSGGGVRGHRVRRRGRPLHGCREGVCRAGPRARTGSRGCGAAWSVVELKAWQARRIADRTFLLSQEAAAFVDAQVAPTAHKIGPVPTARAGGAGHRPVHARPRRGTTAREGRRPLLHRRGPAGLLRRHRRRARHPRPGGAQDLETGSRRGRPTEGLGSEESDVRRSLAVGELARCQPTLDLNPTSVARRDSTEAPSGKSSLRPPHRRRP